MNVNRWLFGCCAGLLMAGCGAAAEDLDNSAPLTVAEIFGAGKGLVYDYRIEGIPIGPTGSWYVVHQYAQGTNDEAVANISWKRVWDDPNGGVDSAGVAFNAYDTICAMDNVATFYEIPGFEPTERMRARICHGNDTCNSPPLDGICEDIVVSLETAEAADAGDRLMTWAVCDSCPSMDVVPVPDPWYDLAISFQGSVPNVICDDNSAESYQGTCSITGPDFGG